MKKLILPLMALLIVCLPTMLFAQQGRRLTDFDYSRKAQSKSENRWTLQDWLAQKDRSRMMDLWLAMYAPSPYEYFIGGGYWTYERKINGLTPTNFTSGKIHIGAYATVLGLEVEHENNTAEDYSDLSGSLNLRIVGNANQGTHLNIQYGLRTREIANATNTETNRVAQQFAGGDMNMYLNQYIGLQGAYKNYLPETNATLGEVTGYRTEGGLFIDFAALRIFGIWYSEHTKSDLTQTGGVRTETVRSGVMSGLRFFF